MNATGQEQEQDKAGDVRPVRVPAGSVVLDGDLGIPDGARGVVLFAHGSAKQSAEFSKSICGKEPARAGAGDFTHRSADTRRGGGRPANAASPLRYRRPR